MLSALARLAPAPGICSLPSHDWLALGSPVRWSERFAFRATGLHFDARTGLFRKQAIQATSVKPDRIDRRWSSIESDRIGSTRFESA
eukprot:485803-Prorocentrum_minimum.AAC.2